MERDAEVDHSTVVLSVAAPADQGHTTVGDKPDRAIATTDLPVGARVGAYLIQERLQSGGCGVVYRAEHRLMGRRAAIKIMHRDLAGSPEMTARFVREARAVNRIAHANIIQIHDIGTLDDGRPYQVMEYLEGIDLDKLIGQRGRLDIEPALGLFEPLCSALHAAHDVGVVHRDVKASNVMVRVGADIERVTLVDFGVAKLLDPGPSGFVTSRGRLIGTPQTMAPEQILGRTVDRRADVYALGVLLFQIVTGRLPFHGLQREVLLEQHLSGVPPRASAHAPVGPAFDRVIARAMAKDPEARFASAAEFLDALRGAVRSPDALVGEKRSAVAIYIKARIAEPDGTAGRDPLELDDILDALGVQLEDLEDWLVDAGFAVPVTTRSGLIGARVTTDGDPSAGCQAERLLRAIAERLAAHEYRHPCIQFSLCLRTGQVEARVGSSRAGGEPQPSAGPLLDPRTWPTPRFDGRAHVADAAGELRPATNR